MSASDEGEAKKALESHSLRGVWRRLGKRSSLDEPGSSTSSTNHHGSLQRVPRSSDRTVSPGRQSGDDEPSDKRRQQVYDAQKRHRQRKDEYVRSLEKEIEKLRTLDAAVCSERLALAEQNDRLRNMLSLPSQSEVSPFLTAQDIGWDGSGVYVQHDDIMDHERIFVEQPPGTSTQTLLNPAAKHTSSEAQQPSLEQDSWAALDFILSLEWPCRHHVQHSITETDPPAKPCGDGINGHAMTRTAAVLAATTLRPAPDGIDSAILQKWQIPHSEIDKLVQLSEQLDLSDDLITPAQAYAALSKDFPQAPILKRALADLKPRLAAVSHCEGLGAVIPTETFRQHLDELLRSGIVS